MVRALDFSQRVQLERLSVASFNVKGSLVVGVLAAIGASVCCVGPLVLVALGIGGAWVSNLTAFEPVRPALVVVTFLFLGLAFRGLYLTAEVCEPGIPCADPRTRVRQRAIFWLVTVALLALLAVPMVVPLFY